MRPYTLVLRSFANLRRVANASRVASLRVFAMLLFLVTSASAKEGDAAAAEVLFQKGREAMEAEDYATACESFAESQRLDPASGTVMNLATCEEKRGELARAWEHWQHALRSLSPDDRRSEFVRKRIAALEADLPKLTITLSAGTPKDVQIERDGVTIGKAAWGEAIPVDPGSHEVVVRSSEHEAKHYQIDVHPGEAKTLEVTTGKKLPAARDPKDAKLRTWSYVAGGVGLVGLGTAAVTGFALIGTKNKVDENCPNKECNSDGMDAVETGQALLTANTIGFIVAGVGLGAGVTLFVLSSDTKGRESEAADRAEVKTRAIVEVTPGGAALTFSGAF